MFLFAAMCECMCVWVCFFQSLRIRIHWTFADFWCGEKNWFQTLNIITVNQNWWQNTFFVHSRKRSIRILYFHAITLYSVADWPNCRLCQNLERKKERKGESVYEKKKKMTLIADCCAADYCWQSTHSHSHSHTHSFVRSLFLLCNVFSMWYDTNN